MASVSGHIYTQPRKKGDVWYMKIQVRDNGLRHDSRKKIGPSWTERSRPPAGYFTRKMAQAALDAALTDIRRGSVPGAIRTGYTFADATAEYLRYVEHEKQRAPSTVSDYRGVIATNLMPEFGAETRLDKISSDRIGEYRDRLLDEGELSRRTIQKILVVLYGVMKRAHRRGWITANPSENVDRVNVSRSGDFNVLSVEQVEAVIRSADNDTLAAVITTAAYSGLRLGEIRALRWRDVDFANALIHVRRNLPRANGERVPKSGKVRSVPLMDDVAKALDALSRRDHFTGPDDRVFCNAVGDALYDGDIRDGFYAALSAAKLGHLRDGEDPIVFHDLRHSYGTLAVNVYALTDVQTYMGHADIQTTMIYVHHVPKRDAAAKLSEFVAAQKAGVVTELPERERAAA